MNRKQKIVLWIGIVIIVLMCLLPPWLRVMELGNSRLVSKTFYEIPQSLDDKWLGLLSPPEPLMAIYKRSDRYFDRTDLKRVLKFTGTDGYKWYSLWTEIRFNYSGDPVGEIFNADYVQIDLSRLSLQCAIVALITGGLLCTLTTKEKYKQKDKKVEI